MRKCVSCNTMKGKKELIRVVKSPNGEIFLDRTGKKNGRGAYICIDPACFNKAIKTKALSREFKMNIPIETYEQIQKQLEENIDG